MTEEYGSTPVEIGEKEKGREVDRAEEFTEISDSVKLEQLSRLMYAEEETKEQFQKLLSSLPVELVRATN